MRLESSLDGSAIVCHNSWSSLVFEVKSNHHLDLALMELKESVLVKLNKSFFLRGDDVLSYQGILCFPDVDGMRDKILEETHGSRYSIHLGSMKM